MIRFFKDLEQQKPDAIVIDLSQIPSQGRHGCGDPDAKKTRNIPIIFVGGKTQKIEQVRNLLPDAVFASWENIGEMLKQAIDTGVGDVVVPQSAFAAYAGKPLMDKLGIRAGRRLTLVNAPNGFASAMGELPSGAILSIDPAEKADLMLWFVHSSEQLSQDLIDISIRAKQSPIWVAWPKKGSAYEGDLSQKVVRQTAMRSGLVDYKICSIDANWSALLFTWRGIVDLQIKLLMQYLTKRPDCNSR